MMGRNGQPQKPLFYAFNLNDLVPQDHLLRQIDRFHVFEQVLQSCIDAGLVGGEGFAVDASVSRCCSRI